MFQANISTDILTMLTQYHPLAHIPNLQERSTSMSSDQLSNWAKAKGSPDVLTTSNGAPVDSKTASMTAGPRGPILLSDFVLIDELAHFDRERIPERVVHAKGAGAFGYFEVTHDITQYCKAKIFERIGKRTKVWV